MRANDVKIVDDVSLPDCRLGPRFIKFCFADPCASFSTRLQYDEVSRTIEPFLALRPGVLATRLHRVLYSEPFSYALSIRRSAPIELSGERSPYKRPRLLTELFEGFRHALPADFGEGKGILGQGGRAGDQGTVVMGVLDHDMGSHIMGDAFRARMTALARAGQCEPLLFDPHRRCTGRRLTHVLVTLYSRQTSTTMSLLSSRTAVGPGACQESLARPCFYLLKTADRSADPSGTLSASDACGLDSPAAKALRSTHDIILQPTDGKSKRKGGSSLPLRHTAPIG